MTEVNDTYLESLEHFSDEDDTSENEPVYDLPNNNIVPMRDWKELLHKTDKGGLINSGYNISLILQNDLEFKGLFKYDTRRNQVVLSRDYANVKAGVNLLSAQGAVRNRINEKYLINPTTMSVNEQIEIEASTHYPYNPLQELFNSAYSNWDGKKRMETLFIDYLGVEDNEVSRKITRVFFDGLIHKVKDPFVKFDRVLDLVGDQGIGKTRIFEILGGEYYTDSIGSLTDKDDKIEMSRNLIVNDDEMAVTNKMSFEDLKKFVSETSLTFRKPYAINPITVGKGFVIVRSTNNIEYLKDKTGNRRFMTLVVSKERRTKNIKDFTREEALQILGEAAHEFVGNDNITEDETLTPEMLAQTQAQSHYTSDIEDTILDWIEANPEEDMLTTKFLAEDVLQINNIANNQKLSRQIKYIMNNLDGWKYGNYRMSNGQRSRGYKRV